MLKNSGRAWSIGLASGHDRDLRPVSFIPVGLEFFFEKWPMVKYPKMGHKTYIWYFPVLWTGSLSSIKYLIK